MLLRVLTILGILAIIYLVPLLSLNTMTLTILGVFLLGIAVGMTSHKRMKYFYPVIVIAAFIPAVYIFDYQQPVLDIIYIGVTAFVSVFWSWLNKVMMLVDAQRRINKEEMK